MRTFYRVPASYQGKQLACRGCGKAFLLSTSPPSDPSGTAAPPPGPIEAVAPEDGCLVLGRLALKHRFLTEEQLTEAVAFQQEEKRLGKHTLLGSLLVRKALITQNQLDFLLSVQMIMEIRKLDRRFGELAVENGFVTQEDVDDALREQQSLFKKTRTIRLVGEILVERGTMDPDKRDAILERQRRLVRGREEPATDVPDGVPEAEQNGARYPGEDGGAEACEAIFQVMLSTDGLEAKITPSRSVPDDISVGNLKSFLARHDVTHGLVPDEDLKGFLREGSRVSHPFTVARGTPPQPGRNAEIRYHFDTDPLKVGTIKEGGGIDFKDRGHIPQAGKGDLLAERIPPEEGIPGVAVTGRPLPPPKPRNIKLRKGKGTDLSEDGLRLHADLPGRPEISADGKVFVFSEHKIQGDVDLKSGHVDFDGDILVSGTVKKGFRVSGGSLAASEVAGAEIDIRGDVVVTGGVIGSTIRAGGNLRARYLHKSRIRAFGDVILEKEAIDADVEISGTFVVKSGSVLSSKVIAKKGVQAGQVGSQTSNPCLLVVGTDHRVKRETQALRDRIETIYEDRNALEEATAALNEKKQKIALELGEVVQQQDATNVKKRQLEEKIDEARARGDQALLKKIEQAVQTLQRQMQAREESLEALFSKEEALDREIEVNRERLQSMEDEAGTLSGEIEHLEEWAKSEAPIPSVKVSGCIFPYTVIKGRHTSLTLPEEHKAVQIREIHIEEPADGKEWKLRLSPLKK